ncbi:MAG: ABC transporter permease, partial [Lachnospiraceae bacterium]
MSTTLFKKEFKNNLLLLGIFCLVLTLYITMIISMFDPALSKSIEAMRESMPEIFALVGMSAPGVTLLDFIVNYLFGFLFKLFPMIFFFILVNRMLIRYIDRGTMAYLLATPNSRIKIVGTQALSICFELFLLLAYICLLVIIISEFMFPGALDLPLFLFTIVGLFGLLLFMSS